MGYKCTNLLDSISEAGKRITTFEITFPRIILSEFNTHRAFSRSSASSRAIPFKRQLQKIMDDPFIPERFPVNNKGMQPQEYYEPSLYVTGFGTTPQRNYKSAKRAWLGARDAMVSQAKILVGESNAAHCFMRDGILYGEDTHYLNVHKQIVNRLLEPWMWHTCIVTSTEFDNFFKLRTDSAAQIEIKTIADMMYDEYYRVHVKCPDGLVGCEVYHGKYEPTLLKTGEWYLPLVYEEDKQLTHTYLFNGGIDGDNKGMWIKSYNEITKKISAARCARVSYLTHDGRRDISKDLELFDKLSSDPLHASPLEHPATPFHEEISRERYQWLKHILENFNHPNHLVTKESLQISFYNKKFWELPRIGNFYGWKQMRKEFVNENCINFRKQ